MSDYEFTVPIEPKGKARHRTANGRAYTPAKQVHWEQQFALFASEHKPDSPLDGPIALYLTAVFSRPKRLMRKKDPPGRIFKDTKPDGDNVLKSVCAALNNQGWWRDDCQFAHMSCMKYYAGKEEAPKVSVRITSLKDLTLSED